MTRIGINLPNSTTASDFLRIAKVADRKGYGSIWKGEQLGRDAISVLGACATATTRIEMATGIINIFVRNPLLTAMTAATVHELSGRRVIMGLSTGNPARTGKTFGVQFDHPLGRLREYIGILRRALSGETLNYKGRFLERIEGFKLGIKAPPSNFPIYVAARHPHMIELAGEIGDGLLMNMVSPNYLASFVLPHIKIGAEKAGRSVNEIDIASFIITCISNDKSAALRAARKAILGYSMLPHIFSMFEREPFLESMKRVRETCLHEGPEKAAEEIPESVVNELSISGPPSIVIAKLQEYTRAGVTLPILYFSPVEEPSGASMEKSVESVPLTD
ncbi:MAG: hypothetical protein CMO12_04100 [Thaumarchaeota archaeon]|nr:hypothetical protein [Nitrososphaerota archaeon]